MTEITHPTNPDWTLFDPEERKPDKEGEVLLLVTKGGVLVTGFWNDTDYIAWGYKPKIPESVKRRLR